jgi:hypothetical protein
MPNHLGLTCTPEQNFALGLRNSYSSLDVDRLAAGGTFGYVDMVALSSAYLAMKSLQAVCNLRRSVTISQYY